MLQPADATTFLLTVGSQLAATRPELFSASNATIIVNEHVDKLKAGGELVGVRIGKMLTSPFAKVALNVNQTVHSAEGRVTGVEIEQWIVEARRFSLQDLQSLALIRPAEILSGLDPSARLVIIIDALDELRFSPANVGILRALIEMPEIPSNLTFIISSRPDPSLEPLLSRSDARELVLDASTDENKTDLRRFISEAVENETFSTALSKNNLPREDFMNALLAKSGGNFLYVRSVLGAVREAASDATKHERLPELLDAKTLPENLAGLYGHFLKSITTWCKQEFPEQTWSKHLGPMLGVLAVAREPLNASRLAAFIDHKPSEVHLLLQETRQFIEIIEDSYGKPALYRIFHRSFAEYLLDNVVNRGLSVDAEDSHFRIADYFLNAWGGLANQLSGVSSVLDADESYGLRHLPAHLCEAGKTELAARVLRALPFIDGKARAGMVFALLEDYAEVLRDGIGDEDRRVLTELDRAISRAAEWLPKYSQSLNQYLFAELYTTETASGTTGSFAANTLLPALNSSGRRWLEPLRRRRTDSALQIPDGPVHRYRNDVAFLSDGVIAIGCDGGIIQLWKEREPLREIIIPDGPDVEVLIECEPGVIAVVGGYIGTGRALLIVEVASSLIRKVCELTTEPGDIIRDIRCLPDKRIAVFTRTGSYHEVDQVTGERVFSTTWPLELSSATITADAKVICATWPEGGSEDSPSTWQNKATLKDLLEPRRVWVWDPRGDLQLLAEYKMPAPLLRKIKKQPEDVLDHSVDHFDAVAVRPDGTLLLAHVDKCYLGDPKSRRIQYAFSHSSAITRITAGPGDLIALCGQDVALRRQPLNLLPASESDGERQAEVKVLAPLPDGKALVFGGMNDLSCFNPINANVKTLGVIRSNRFLVDSAAVLDNGIVALASVFDGWAVALDSGKNMHVIGRLKTYKVSSTHGRVASFLCSEEDGKTIKKWDSKTGRLEVIRLEDAGKEDLIWAFVQLDEHRFAFGSSKGRVWLWDMRSKEEVQLGSVGFTTNGLAVGPGGQLVACFEDGTLTLWDLDAGGDPVSILLEGRPVALACAPTSP